MTGRWQGSTRKATLPPHWTQLRAAVLRRDGGRCTWRTGGGQICGRPATDVDHVKRNGGDQPGNLRSLCATHHARKSSAEGNAARWANRTRPTEPHPGLRPPGG